MDEVCPAIIRLVIFIRRGDEEEVLGEMGVDAEKKVCYHIQTVIKP